MFKHVAARAALFLGLAILAPVAHAADQTTIVVKNAWIRATPNGATVAGGYATVTNTGSAPDRMVSASIPLATTGELHTMSMQNGIMHMSRLDQGLVMAPGATVTLTPGGDHVMFLKPTAPLTEKQTVTGSMTFEKAGTIPVTFTVAGMAAKVAPGGTASMHGMHHMDGMDMDGMNMKGMDMKGH